MLWGYQFSEVPASGLYRALRRNPFFIINHGEFGKPA